ncbi:dihydroorotate dehydrogenase [Candidatus Bathyarchaeota archaeon]|nr:dihydroorotate dehydrogenase [Candidatus Bathyarchaeota archaeon]
MESSSSNLAGLRTQIANLIMPNPTMLASGILGISAETLLEVAEAGAGAVVTKSIGLKPNSGYPNPTVIQVECGFLNAVGLPNPGIRKFAEEIRKLKKLKVPLIISIFGFSPSEYAEVASVAAEAGADALELNLSCPHVKGTGSEIGQDPDMIKLTVKAVKNRVNKPIFAKLTPNTAHIATLAEAAASAGADAITAINTVRAMAIDVETFRPILANRFGGLSGAAIKPIAIRCVYEIYEAVNVPIIGCGGIRTWKDAVEFMLAGASAIQVGSAIALEGLSIFSSICHGISAYLERKGFRSVNEIVGLAHKK